MELKQMNRLYDDIISLQVELEDAIDTPTSARDVHIKALAAAYELQDYLASAIAAENDKR